MNHDDGNFENRLQYVPYDDSIHRDQLYTLFYEYGENIKREVTKHHGISLFPQGVKYATDALFPALSAIKPPEGIILLLAGEEKVEGMIALRKLGDKVGEIKHWYIRPKHQGKGYGTPHVELLLDKARELGYTILRLDARTDSEAAIHIYKKVGFKERGYYPGGSQESSYRIYMEKKL